MIVSVHGAYHGDNFGDILLIDILLKTLRKEFPSIKINLPYCPKGKGKVFDCDFSNPELILSSKAFVYAGGGYFGEPNSNVEKWGDRNAVRYANPGLLALRAGVPIFIVGVGFGPITNKDLKSKVGEIVKRAKFIGVRDVESKQFLESLDVKFQENIRVYVDYALSVSKAYRRIDKSPSERLGKILVHLPSRYGDNRFRTLWDNVAMLRRERGCEVIRLEDFQVPVTRRLLKYLLATIRFEMKEYGYQYKRFPYREPYGLLRFMRGVDFVVTNKLHVGIVAAALGIPAVAFMTHNKTIRFYRQLDRQEYCISNLNISYSEFKEIIFKSAKNNRSCPHEALEKADGLLKDFCKSLNTCINEYEY